MNGASQVALVVKKLSANAGDLRDMGSIPGSRRSPGGENGKSLRYSSILEWRSPWTEEPGRLQSMGSQSRTWLSDLHDYMWWATAAFCQTPWSLLCTWAAGGSSKIWVAFIRDWGSFSVSNFCSLSGSLVVHISGDQLPGPSEWAF